MKRLLALAIVICIALTGTYAFSQDIAIKEYVTVGGVKCKERQNLLTYLFIGVDDDGEVKAKTEYDGYGQSDVLALLVIDKAANTYATIIINRDTITDVHSLTIDGEDLGAYPVQISLAHANGDGMEMSCENTVQAVSDLLLGVRIDRYMSLNMDAIGIINQSVGGVEVTLEDDFTSLDPAMKQGKTIRLDDKQAVLFVRSRMGVGDGTNTSRIRRQQQYINAIKPMLLGKYQSDNSFPIDLAHSLQPYMVTNTTDKDYSYIAKAVLKNEDLGTFQLEGSSEVDSYGFNAFYPDQDKLTDLVIQIFYKRVQE